MKKRTTLWGAAVFALALVLGMALTGCPTGSDGTGTTAATTTGDTWSGLTNLYQVVGSWGYESAGTPAEYENAKDAEGKTIEIPGGITATVTVENVLTFTVNNGSVTRTEKRNVMIVLAKTNPADALPDLALFVSTVKPSFEKGYPAADYYTSSDAGGNVIYIVTYTEGLSVDTLSANTLAAIRVNQNLTKLRLGGKEYTKQ